LTLIVAGLAVPLSALAQSDPAPPATSPSQSGKPAAAPSKGTASSAQSEAGEPRAMTSEAAPAPASEPAHAPPAEHSSRSTAGPSKAPAGGKPAGVDRLELGTATVTGDREQPKVMYIVPWKRSDIGDLSGKPMNSLLDEALAPIDRDEFKRQVMYYQVVKADASQNGASKAAPAQGEK
jgi:hypothetical protein